MKVKVDGCHCHSCLNDPSLGFQNPVLRHMVLCPKCGNKRCPHATSHVRDCTGSNRSGQPGSYHVDAFRKRDGHMSCNVVVTSVGKDGQCGRPSSRWVGFEYGEHIKDVYGFCDLCSAAASRSVSQGGREVPYEEIVVMEVLES